MFSLLHNTRDMSEPVKFYFCRGENIISPTAEKEYRVAEWGTERELGRVLPVSIPHQLFNPQYVGARYCRISSKLDAHGFLEASLGLRHAEALPVQREHLQLHLAVHL